MTSTAGIVGAGVAGRILALNLARAGWNVTIYDKDSAEGRESCSWTGAGMIAPYCEQESAEPIICEIGLRSLELWPELLKSLPARVFYQQEGSLVVAHPNDIRELQRLEREVASRNFPPGVMQHLDATGIREMEPELAGRFVRGLYFPNEAQLDNWQLMPALDQALQEAGVTRYYHTEVQKIAAHTIEVNGETVRYDIVCDCRGPDAENDLPQLRGVRGELLHVIAPDVKLRRPVRMMHPRYPLYIVPREDDRYVIGATKIESSDRSEISVRATLELLSAAYALHPGFAEARIIETNTHCRPAWRDNLPYLEYQPGLVRINGMYRHGFLIAPALCEVMTQKICGHEPEGAAARLIRIDGRRAYDEVDG